MINLNNTTKLSKTIRGLSIDAINQSNSGHPGLPLGCADIISVLYTHHLKHNPKNPEWINRDRFVLSAGHGSMLLYAILHLCGYALTLEDIKNFRQLHSHTAGHPEYDPKLGIETTTGPLGQGIGHAVGMAIAEKIQAAHFNTDTDNPFDHNIYCLAGDGCLMEGISAEASSFAGHLKLDNLIVIYDSNDICLDGPTSECFTENVEQRYQAYGWDTITIDGHNHENIHHAFTEAKTKTKPVLIIAKTHIGYGSPNRANSSEAHGKPLGTEEAILTKKALNIPIEPLFHIPDDLTSIIESYQKNWAQKENTWQTTFNNWQSKNPEKSTLHTQFLQKDLDTKSIQNTLENLTIKENSASRAASQSVLNTLSEIIPNLIGGSADLSCSDSTFIKTSDIISKDNFKAKNIKYGVREFAMSTIAAGLSLSNTIRPFIGTFLTFSDYMKNGIRLAALMKRPVIYQFTHDSIFLGEDGPTHQPIEQLASLRSIPDLTVIRPADSTEVKGAWLTALSRQTPTALILSRQSLPDLGASSIEKVKKGGYIIKEASQTEKIDIAILATGSEVSLALEVAQELETQQKSCRVISFPSWECFNEQDDSYKDSILSETIQHYVVIEAQTQFGWHQYTGRNATFITVETFGASAPAKDIAKEYGFTVESILQKINKKSPNPVINSL